MTVQLVAHGFVVLVPLLLGFLGRAGFARDRLSSAVLLSVTCAFGAAIVFAAVSAIGSQPPGSGPRLLPDLPWIWGALWAAASLGLALRLSRDRRQRHRRSTLESLAVLGSGAILLAVLISLPQILAELARLRAV